MGDKEGILISLKSAKLMISLCNCLRMQLHAFSSVDKNMTWLCTFQVFTQAKFRKTCPSEDYSRCCNYIHVTNSSKSNEIQFQAVTVCRVQVSYFWYKHASGQLVDETINGSYKDNFKLVKHDNFIFLMNKEYIYQDNRWPLQGHPSWSFNCSIRVNCVLISLVGEGFALNNPS